MANPSDPIRSAVVAVAYDVHKRVMPSENGYVTGAQLASEVRKRTGFDRREIGAAIDYLVGAGHLEHYLQPIMRNGETLPGIGKHLYRITTVGIDLIEEESRFMKQQPGANIVVTNSGGITVVGDNNTVSVSNAHLAAVLREIAGQIERSSAIAPQSKQDALADIQTIDAQIKKSAPNRSILATAWKGVEGIVTATEFASLTVRAYELLKPLL